MMRVAVTVFAASVTALFLMWLRRPKWQQFGKISVKLSPNKEFAVTYLDQKDDVRYVHTWAREKDGTIKHFVDGELNNG